MLQRSEGSEESSSEVSESDKLMGCLEKCGKDVDCISACYGEEKEESSSDEVVKAGSLAVKVASSEWGKIFIWNASDTDTITFSTSEEVEVTKVTLERYGYSKSTDVYRVWLEDSDGKQIAKPKIWLNNKGQVTLSIDKSYRSVDGTLDATIVVETEDSTNSHGWAYTIPAAWATLGFKVISVESSAEDVDIEKYTPHTYEVVAYDGLAITVTPKAWAMKNINYADGEMYEVAKFKVKASDESALLVNGFTLNQGATTLKVEDYIDDVEVTVNDEAVKGLKFTADKKDLTISFNTVEIDAKASANFVVSISLKDYDEAPGATLTYTLKGNTFNATEKKSWIRVSIADQALQPYTFLGGKVKYTSSKLAKVEVEAGATDVVVAEWSLEIPEAINATFSITADADVEEMSMFVAGEEFEGVRNGGAFDFDVELTKSGKVQFKVAIDDNATKWAKLSITNKSINTFTTMVYDSNNGNALGQATGTISFSEITVVKAKSSLENNLDDGIEFVKGDTANRKVVFEGTYTAKKADVYLEKATFAGDNPTTAGGHNNPTTFYVFLDDSEVVSIDNAGAEEFTRVLVKAGETISVKVEADVEANDVHTNYAVTLALDGKDVDDGNVTWAPVALATFSVVDKGSVSVTTSTWKTTVLLKKANTSIAQFTVKPEKSGDDVDFDDMVLQAGALGADDLIVKIDGTAEEWEDVAPYAAQDYALSDLVVYGNKIYKNTTAITDGGHAWNAWEWTDTWLNVSTADAAAILYDLTETLDSNGVAVEIILKTKTAWTVTLKVTDINGKNPSKTFTKRFENAIVYVADQINKEWSTQFVLWVERDDTSKEVTDVCLFYNDGAAKSKCLWDSVSNGNDDLEIVNQEADGKQVMIDAISYCIGADDCAAPTCADQKAGWNANDPATWIAGNCNVAITAAAAEYVLIDKDTYNDYFKVGDTYAKIFKS